MWKQQHKELQKTSYLWQAPQVVPIIPSLSHHPALLLLVSLHPHQLKNPDPIIFLACSIPEYICYFFKPYFLTQLKQRTSSNVRFQTGLERPGVQCVQYTISCWWQISIKWPFQQMDRLATWFGHLGVHCEASDQRERGNCGQGSKFCCTLSGDGCADADSVTPSSNTRRHTIVPWMEIFSHWVVMEARRECLVIADDFKGHSKQLFCVPRSFHTDLPALAILLKGIPSQDQITISFLYSFFLSATMWMQCQVCWSHKEWSRSGWRKWHGTYSKTSFRW